jgi:quercetin dioxygenase-like cupin family protein
MRRVLPFLIVLVAAFTFGAVLMAQDSSMAGRGAMSSHVAIQPDQIKWGPAPPGLPPGAMMAVLDGDPGKDGLYVLRAKFPAGYRIPAHWHTNAEHITVLSGNFYAGAGDKLDKAQATKLGAGGYLGLPGKMHHFAYCEEETVVQIHGMGPFDITYINPADDPRGAGARGMP